MHVYVNKYVGWGVCTEFFFFFLHPLPGGKKALQSNLGGSISVFVGLGC